MSAEKLRRAAALMRERAHDATNVTGASDWFTEVRGMHFTGEYGVRSSGGFVAGDTSEEEAEHIASWHPDVALVVADWLDTIATDFYGGIRAPKNIEHISTFPVVRHALAVANAYLGES